VIWPDHPGFYCPAVKVAARLNAAPASWSQFQHRRGFSILRNPADWGGKQAKPARLLLRKLGEASQSDESGWLGPQGHVLRSPSRDG